MFARFNHATSMLQKVATHVTGEDEANVAAKFKSQLDKLKQELVHCTEVGMHLCAYAIMATSGCAAMSRSESHALRIGIRLQLGALDRNVPLSMKEARRKKQRDGEQSWDDASLK